MARDYTKWDWRLLDSSPETKKWIRNLPDKHIEYMCKEYLSFLYREEDIPEEIQDKIGRCYMNLMHEITDRRDAIEARRKRTSAINFRIACITIAIAITGIIVGVLASWR